MGKSKSGFTIVDLPIVIAVIGNLAAITVGTATLGLDIKTMSSNIDTATGFATCNSDTANGWYCYVPSNASGTQCSNGEICLSYYMNYMNYAFTQKKTLTNLQGKI